MPPYFDNYQSSPSPNRPNERRQENGSAGINDHVDITSSKFIEYIINMVSEFNVNVSKDIINSYVN
jgi:hypothetical protein